MFSHTVASRGVGIYLDGGSSNYVVDHNVVWDVDTGVKLNPPSANDLVQNNTLAGSANSLSSDATGLPNSTMANNIFIGPVQISANEGQPNNLSDPASSIFLAPKAGNFGLRRARFMRVVALSGLPPDVGAYALGQRPFVAGATIKMKGVRLL